MNKEYDRIQTEWEQECNWAYVSRMGLRELVSAKETVIHDAEWSMWVFLLDYNWPIPGTKLPSGTGLTLLCIPMEWAYAVVEQANRDLATSLDDMCLDGKRGEFDLLWTIFQEKYALFGEYRETYRNLVLDAGDMIDWLVFRCRTNRWFWPDDPDFDYSGPHDPTIFVRVWTDGMMSIGRVIANLVSIAANVAMMFHELQRTIMQQMACNPSVAGFSTVVLLVQGFLTIPVVILVVGAWLMVSIEALIIYGAIWTLLIASWFLCGAIVCVVVCDEIRRGDDSLRRHILQQFSTQLNSTLTNPPAAHQSATIPPAAATAVVYHGDPE